MSGALLIGLIYFGLALLLRVSRTSRADVAHAADKERGL